MSVFGSSSADENGTEMMSGNDKIGEPCDAISWLEKKRGKKGRPSKACKNGTRILEDHGLAFCVHDLDSPSVAY